MLLTYRRIQDIHLTRNLVQRWLGLATVAIQTASGTATAEMGLEGILEAEPLRDFLYQQMRGARGEAMEHPAAVAEQDDALTLLREIRDALQAPLGEGFAMNGRVEQASAWIYRGVWRVLVDLFHVPEHPPTLPCEPGETLQVFRRGSASCVI